MTQLVGVMNDVTIHFISIKEDFQIVNTIFQCIKLTKGAVIYIVSELIDHAMLEMVLAYFPAIQYEKYYAKPLALPLGGSIKRPYQMNAMQKLKVPKVAETQQSAKKGKKKKKRSTGQKTDVRDAIYKQPDIIKLIKGTKCMDQFERNVIALGKKGDLRNHLYIIKGDCHNKLGIMNASIPVITYFDEIDCAFEKLVDVLNNLKYPSIQWFGNHVLPQVAVAIFQIPHYIFDKICSRLHSKYINVKEVDNEIKYVYLWIRHFGKLMKETEVKLSQLRLPKLDNAESTGIVVDFLSYSLEALCEIKFKRIGYDLNHTYQEFIPFVSMPKHFLKLQDALKHKLPQLLHKIIPLDPKRSAGGIQIIFNEVEKGIALSCSGFQIWKGQLDMLSDLYTWRKQRNSSAEPATITISTWIINEESGFNEMLRKVVGNDTIIQRGIIDMDKTNDREFKKYATTYFRI